MGTTLEYVLTNSYKADMISYLESHPEDFEEVIKLALSDKKAYAWRAAWLLWSCMDDNDLRIKGYIKDLINNIPEKNDDHQREYFIILNKMELDHGDEGTLFDICAETWVKINKKPSVRYNAFKLMIKIAEKHPSLSQELDFITQDQYMETLSDTAKKSVFRMMLRLNPDNSRAKEKVAEIISKSRP